MKIHYSKHISWQLLNNEVYIIDEITSRVYCLKDVAKEIWILIRNNNSIEQIIENLKSVYSVSNNILENDTNEFIDSLILENLIVKEVN